MEAASPARLYTAMHEAFLLGDGCLQAALHSSSHALSSSLNDLKKANTDYDVHDLLLNFWLLLLWRNNLKRKGGFILAPALRL